MKNPFLKFYTSDWRSDPALKMCSMAARGLWIELICLMHEASPYGHLLVNGHSVTDAQLGALVGAPPEQITALLGELEAAGVFSRTRAGVIYSRKLTRLAKKAATARNNGRKGGNPSLSNTTENPPLDNPELNPEDKPQKPESRSHIDGGGGSAGARDPQPAEASQPKTFREKMLETIGVDPVSGLTGRGGAMLGTQADMLEARRWFTDLKLTPTEVLAVVAEAMQRKPDGPPSRFSYFTKAMQRYAAAKAAAAQPLAPSPHTADATRYRPDMPPKVDVAAVMADIRREREERENACES